MLKTILGTRNFVSRLDTTQQEALCLCRIINLLASPLAQEASLVTYISFLRYPAGMVLRKILFNQSILLFQPNDSCPLRETLDFHVAVNFLWHSTVIILYFI